MTAPMTAPGPVATLERPRTLVVHVSDPEGFDTYIGRGLRFHADPRVRRRSPWANPWRIGQIEETLFGTVALDRTEVLRRYESITLPEIRERLGAAVWADELALMRGERLGCHCAEFGHPLTADDPLVCHGQLVARAIEEVIGR